MGVADEIVSIAKGQVGYREGYSGGHYNNKNKFSPDVPGLEWSNYQPWCATFVSWCAMRAGEADMYPRTASCLTGVNWFRNRGRFSWYPAVGAQVFFGANGGSHTGIVYRFDGDHIWTIEGNTNNSGSAEGNGVYLKKRRRRDSYTYGYGVPDFPEGVVSADPKWGGASRGSSDADPSKGGVARYQVTIDGEKYGYGARGKHVTAVGKALKAAGFDRHHDGDGYQPGPRWTDYDTKNYAAYQRSLGYRGSDADGVPGKGSLSRLLDGKAKPEPVKWLKFTGYMPELHYGDESWHVDFAQRMLNRFLKHNIKTDGKYGDETAKAVDWFYLKYLGYDTKSNGRVLGADGWRRALSISAHADGSFQE